MLKIIYFIGIFICSSETLLIIKGIFNCSSETLLMTKKFNIRKIKTVLYSKDLLLKAEHYFPEFANIDYSEEIDLKKNDFFMVTSVCKYNNTRYKGIQRLDYEGVIDPEAGINMDCEEWDAFVKDFPLIKEAWEKKPRSCKRKLDSKTSPSDVPTFEWKWLFQGQVVKSSNEELYYTAESAKHEAEICLPDVRDAKKGDLELEVKCVYKAPPYLPDHMLLCYLTLLENRINDLKLSNCQAHKDEEENSQIPHTREGNCLDESTDHVEKYFETAKSMVTTPLLVSVFSSSRARIGARSMFAIQSAQTIKCVMPDFLLKQKIKRGFAGPKRFSLKKVIQTADMAMKVGDRIA